MTLETMRPTPTWDAASHEDVLAPFRDLRDRLTIHVWGGDWCPDCRGQLPAFAAALDAADVPADAVHEHAVDRDKDGPLVDEYGVEYIPTVVVELDGEEVARFVEEGDRPIATILSDELAAHAE